ncbi:pyridoxamine 5'-phosphate oxidase family protein [Spongiimicrobium salis]|uniref:pyridoxamine 5'-phosphate oxidase family protein n=1 Tax=Spongiimicrobium salis TaxID=1667022 RepID=UPI00374D23C9
MSEYHKNALNKVKRGAKRAVYDVEKINEILDAGFIGYVSYTYEGQTMCLPMAYGRDDNKIYLHGSLKNRMFEHILRSDNLSMTVMHLDALVLARSGLHHSVNYRSAVVFGKTKRIDDLLLKEKALKCVVDHMILGRWEELRPINEKELKATLVIELEIITASAKIRDVGVSDEKADEQLPIWAGLVPLQQIAKYPISDDLLPKDVPIPSHVLDYYESNK